MGQSTTIEFSNVVNQRTYDDSNADEPNALAIIYIRFDPRYDSYERKIYSILEMLGDIGGLQQSLFIMGMLLCQFFTYRVFISSLLKQVYQIKSGLFQPKEDEALQQ